MRCKALLSLALAVLACIVGLTGEVEAAPAKRVYAGVYLHDVARFDQKDGVFDADFEVWAKWLGDFDPEKLSIANAAEVERELIGEEKDGDWRSARWRVRGTLRGEFPVHNFPFDEQTLSVVLELPEKYGVLVPDLAGSGMRERFSVTGWNYEPVFKPRRVRDVYQSDLGAISGEGKPTVVHRNAYEVKLRRPLIMAATKLFLPLFVILLVAVVALFINAAELEVRAAVGVTALLACFAFQFAVADSMPSVSYMTLADIVFLVAYAITAVLMCISVAAFWLHSREKHTAWRWLDIGAVVAFVLVMIGSVVLAYPETAVAHADAASEIPQPRPASNRELLRVGMVTVAARGGGLARHGVYWGTTREEPGGSRYAFLVDHRPSISNDTLTFRADGTLEVRWRLRPDLKWSDGHPLTTEDLRFAMEVDADPRVASIDVKSETEMYVRWKERVAAALDPIQPVPRHVLKEVFDKGGYEAVRLHRQKNPLPGLGPYQVTKFEEDKLLVMEKNPHFSGNPASIERIEIYGYPDDKALITAFERGAIDMIAPNSISPESAVELRKRRPEAVHIRPSEVLYYLHADTSHKLLSKIAARKAILTALDREKLRDEVFGETASAAPVATIPVVDKLPKDTPVTQHDLEAAREQIAKLGLSGARFPLYHDPSPVEREIAKRVVAQLAEVGIEIEVKEQKRSRDKIRARNHGGFVLSFMTCERDDEPARFWDVPRIGSNYDLAYRSEAFDNKIADLVEREERALYRERREQIRDLLFKAYAERLPTLPLFHLADRVVAHPELQGWKVGTGRNFAATLERWHFVKLDPKAKTAGKP